VTIIPNSQNVKPQILGVRRLLKREGFSSLGLRKRQESKVTELMPGPLKAPTLTSPYTMCGTGSGSCGNIGLIRKVRSRTRDRANSQHRSSRAAQVLTRAYKHSYWRPRGELVLPQQPRKDAQAGYAAITQSRWFIHCLMHKKYQAWWVEFHRTIHSPRLEIEPAVATDRPCFPS
jgi:hypothetical protein